MTLLYLQVASALTIGKCGLVSILSGNSFTKLMKKKIQTRSLTSSGCALFCHQMGKSSSQVLAPRCPSLTVPCSPADKKTQFHRSHSYSSLRSKEFIFLSPDKSAARNFIYSYFTDLVRIESVSISLLNWILQHFIVTLLKWPFSARAAKLSPLIDGKTYFSWAFKNVLRTCLGMIYSTDWTKYISILMHKSSNK